MSKAIKFDGPKDQVKLDFRALPTPMVAWEGTAQELHDLLFRAAVGAGQEEPTK